MHKIVYSCFKAIMMSMIFIFVFDTGFYVYRVLVLNQRMENIMNSMQKVVMENNYLPEGDFNMYSALLKNIMTDMNGNVPHNFVQAMDLNYGHNAFTGNSVGSGQVKIGGSSTLNVLRKDQAGNNVYVNVLIQDMSQPAEYGDIMVVQSSVCVNQTMWGFSGSQRSGADWGQTGRNQTVFHYTYFVPCLKYNSLLGA